MFEGIHLVRQIVIGEHLFDFGLRKPPEFFGNVVEYGDDTRIIHTRKYRFFGDAHAARDDTISEVTVGLEAGGNEVSNEADGFIEQIVAGVMHVVDGGILQRDVILVD